ncbi:hypothetical protein MXB_214 [Myxobolus squamalis]|nr:hypothetical protein MXB_214 [Myxobolus squamalis]
MEELIDELSNGRTLYGAISVEDPNTSLQKIQGQCVPANIRGKVASFSSAIKQFFRGHSIEITATSEEDLSIDIIKEKVKSASGSNYSIHEKKSKDESKTHEVMLTFNNYRFAHIKKLILFLKSPMQETFSHNQFDLVFKNIKQAVNFVEEFESERKSNSANTVREQRKKEMDEMIKISRQPLAARLKFETSDQPQKKEENLNSSERIKEIRLKEMQEMIKRSKEKDQRETNELSVLEYVSLNLDDKHSRQQDKSTYVLRENELEFSTDDQTQEKNENFNSVEKIKELRRKELQDTIQQSKVKAMKDQISSEESASSSHKKTVCRPEIQTPGNVKSAKETFNANPIGKQFVRTKKDLGIELPSISSKKALIQNLYQTQSPIESTSGSPSTQISERKKVFFSNYILDSRIEMPIHSSNIDEKHNIMVEVLYDYIAENEGDLSIKLGEILTVFEKNGDWWTAINSSGKKGHIPANYVEKIDLSTIKTSEQPSNKNSELNDTFSMPETNNEDLEIKNSKCPVTVVGCYDYEPDEKGELSFTEGEKLTIIDKTDPHWWKATNSEGVTGDIPSNYVKELLNDKLSDMFPKNPLEGNKYKAEHSYEKGCYQMTLDGVW